MDIEAPPPQPAPQNGKSASRAAGTVLTFLISYYVPGKKRGTRVQLLGGPGGAATDGRDGGVSGFLLPGQMLCVLGPSGCGKTTLFDLLSGRKTYGTVEGEMLFDGAAPTPSMLRRHLGYVEQQDTLLGMLTPAEMLMYTAELKQPRGMPRADKAAAVADLVRRLGLQRCQHTVIGSVLRRWACWRDGRSVVGNGEGQAALPAAALDAVLCDAASTSGCGATWRRLARVPCRWLARHPPPLQPARLATLTLPAARLLPAPAPPRANPAGASVAASPSAATSASRSSPARACC